jgi:hypothetical protein
VYQVLEWAFKKGGSQKLGQDVIDPRDINWVLTVPAIWSDAAKQFMREAAVEV